MSKKLKGFGPLLMVLGIMIVLIIILVFATQVYVKTHMTNVKLEVTVAIESDARGSWPVSFLKSETGGMSYMEILGSVRADNYNDFLGERLKVIEDQVKKSAELDKKQKEVKLENRIVVGQAASAGSRVLIDIPLPGGERSSLEIKED